MPSKQIRLWEVGYSTPFETWLRNTTPNKGPGVALHGTDQWSVLCHRFMRSRKQRWWPKPRSAGLGRTVSQQFVDCDNGSGVEHLWSQVSIIVATLLTLQIGSVCANTVDAPVKMAKYGVQSTGHLGTVLAGTSRSCVGVSL